MNISIYMLNQLTLDQLLENLYVLSNPTRQVTEIVCFNHTKRVIKVNTRKERILKFYFFKIIKIGPKSSIRPALRGSKPLKALKFK